MPSFLVGAYEELAKSGLLDDYEVWRDLILGACDRAEESRGIRDWRIDDWKRVLQDEDLAATVFMKELYGMAIQRKSKPKARGRRAGAKATAPTKFVLPTERRAPSDDMERYAYLLTGEKKIGKTTFAIEGCEEFVIQFDKPQLAYEVRETCPKTWREFLKVLEALEDAAKSDDFPYTRVVLDGVGEWYQACMEHVLPVGCKDPTDADDFGRTWRALATEFMKAVNRLLALQIDADCGLVFIAHSEWKEKKTRSGKMQVLVPNLTSRCEEILNGKVDAWFQYDYADDQRLLIVQGSQTIAAGHRIDGHFLTPSGERVREIPMGSSAAEAREAFAKAFQNKQEHASYDDFVKAARVERTARRSRSKKKVARR